MWVIMGVAYEMGLALNTMFTVKVKNTNIPGVYLKM